MPKVVTSDCLFCPLKADYSVLLEPRHARVGPHLTREGRLLCRQLCLLLLSFCQEGLERDSNGKPSKFFALEQLKGDLLRNRKTEL